MMNAKKQIMNPRKDIYASNHNGLHSFAMVFDMTKAVKTVIRQLNRFTIIFLIACMALYETFYRNSETGRVLTFLYLILVAFRSWFLLVKSSEHSEEKVNRSF